MLKFKGGKRADGLTSLQKGVAPLKTIQNVQPAVLCWHNYVNFLNRSLVHVLVQNLGRK